MIRIIDQHKTEVRNTGVMVLRVVSFDNILWIYGFWFYQLANYLETTTGLYSGSVLSAWLNHRHRNHVACVRQVPHGFCDLKIIFRLHFLDWKHSAFASNGATSDVCLFAHQISNCSQKQCKNKHWSACRGHPEHLKSTKMFWWPGLSPGP